MRFILSIALALVLALVGRADEMAKAAASLALAKRQRERAAGTADEHDQARSSALLMLHKVQRDREQAALQAKPLSYAEAYEQAMREKKRLAVFVDLPVREIPGVITVSVQRKDGFFEYPPQTVAVSAVQTGALYLLRVLPATATNDEIRTVLRPEVQALAPGPFGRSRHLVSLVSGTPDGKPAAGELPVGR